MICDPCLAKRHPSCVNATPVPALGGCDCPCDWSTWTEVPLAERYTWRERAFLGERFEVECILAEALGYPNGEHGWAIGDHTPVTLAMEVRRRGIIPDGPVDVPDPGADLPIADAAFIAVRAAYYSWSTAEPNTAAGRAAYRAWTAAIGVSRRLDRDARWAAEEVG
jgi:hypothetical protein